MKTTRRRNSSCCAAAYQAYYESMPLRASALPSGSHMRLYRRLKFGSLIDLSVLDTRQWRSDQPCGDGSRTNCAERLAPTQTMMGPEQEKWLFDNLATVKARWTVIGQQVYSFAFDRSKANPDGQFSMDKWDGYVAARQRLYTRLLETHAPNPIVLSGDVHQHYGADLKMDFTDPRSATVGTEFTNTSITTGGDGADVGTSWEATRADNPHIKYHSNRRGYIVCTATPATMRADFKIIDKVSMPDLPARIGGSMVVHAGRPGGETD
jgi:alkaline phosphatase D